MVTKQTVATAKRATAFAAAKRAVGAAIVVAAGSMSASERIANECICARLRLLNRVVSGIYDEALRPLGLELSQLSVLIAIDLHGDHATATRLAKALQVEKSSISRELQRLEDRAFIRRSPSETERAVRIALTARGRRLISAALPGWERAQAKAGELLSQGLRAAVAREVRRVPGLSLALRAPRPRA
jgi:DNA-binding MarR family transcriptional regulator